MDADVLEDLVSPLVGHRLGAADGRHLGGELVPVGVLVEVNSVRVQLVKRLYFRVDRLVRTELALRPEDDRDQREFGLMDRDLTLPEGFSEPPVQVFKNAAAL